MNKFRCEPYEKFCKRLCSGKRDHCFFIHTDYGEKRKCRKCLSWISLETPYMCWQKDYYLCCLCYANDRMRFLGHYLFLVEMLPLFHEFPFDLIPTLKMFLRQFLVLNEEIFYFESISLECILRWRLSLFWSNTFTIEFSDQLLYVRNQHTNNNQRNIYILQRTKGNWYTPTLDWESPEKQGWVKWISLLKRIMLTETEFIISDSFIENLFANPILQGGSKSFLIKF